MPSGLAAIQELKMEPWHFLKLGDAMLAAEPSGEVEECFLKAFEAAGRPSEMAVFTRRASI